MSGNLNLSSAPFPFASKLKTLVITTTKLQRLSLSSTKSTTSSMATSLICHLSAPPSSPVIDSTFLHGSTKIFSAPPRRAAVVTARRSFKSVAASNNVPKQFREENLKDGLMDNYMNVPQSLYGLTPSQMDMFMTEDNPCRRQAESVTEESISSAHNYLNHGGVWTMSGMENGGGVAKYSMSVSMYRGGARGGFGRPKTAPPDLPSLLLDARIIYLGMPIVPEVTELLVAQFMWLDFDNPSKPIYLYINSSGTQNEKRESVGAETDAYAIADMMNYVKSDVYTVNCGMAYGQAAMLLALGAKGYRAVQPNSSTKLHLPIVSKSSGAAIDMYIKGKELDVNADYYIELLAKGTGKSKEELAQDIRRVKYFTGQAAIEYGLVDKIIDSRDSVFEKRNYEDMLTQSRAMRRAAGGPQAAPSGFR